MHDLLARMRARTQARIGIGRIGHALPTRALLDFELAHARARDAVHAPFDAAAVAAAMAARETIAITSRARHRTEYLQRPDLGRRVADADVARLTGGGAELALVVGDGLSATAVHSHAGPLVTALLNRLGGWTVAPIVIAQHARVALGDEVGALLGARIVVVLIGERPGLSAPDSLGAYLTWGPRAGRLDSERNCVSNIRPPHGLGYEEAAELIARLLHLARARGETGVALKDEATAAVLGSG